ncbi:MAG TPA: hypothetical protein VJR94_10950 [Candidatus Nitrosocosmicus sp.]|nr:hypothetical protein [Candidatus Nitrosocosmicus sp.]
MAYGSPLTELKPANEILIGNSLNMNQGINKDPKSETSYDNQTQQQISFASNTEIDPLTIDLQSCQLNFCVKEGEPVTFSVDCEGTDPNMIVTCTMVESPQGAVFTIDKGNPTKGIFYFFPKTAGFYEASFQTKVLYCPPNLNECFDNQKRTVQIQAKPDCGNKQFEFYNGDIDLLPFPRLGSILKGLPAVEFWYSAIYKDMFTYKEDDQIFWSYTKSDPPQLTNKDLNQNIIDCDSSLTVKVNILFPDNPNAQLNPAEKKEWFRFTLALANHEVGHVKIIKEGYYGNYDGKWEHKGGFNGIMEKVIGLTTERALEEIAIRETETQLAHDKYDEDTKHGTTTDPNHSPFGPAKLTLFQK